MLFHEYMVGRGQSSVFEVSPKFLSVSRCVLAISGHSGDPTFSELIRMRPSCSIRIDTYGSVACIKGQGLDTFGNRVDPW